MKLLTTSFTFYNMLFVFSVTVLILEWAPNKQKITVEEANKSTQKHMRI